MHKRVQPSFPDRISCTEFEVYVASKAGFLKLTRDYHHHHNTGEVWKALVLAECLSSRHSLPHFPFSSVSLSDRSLIKSGLEKRSMSSWCES